MQGQKPFHDKVSRLFRLSERVLKHTFYRRLRDVLDGAFLRAQTRPVYNHTGQPSPDPIMFFKRVLVGRLENRVSDRRLDIRYFLGYEVDEDLPWHSTIIRTQPLSLSTSLTKCLPSAWLPGWWQVIRRSWIRPRAPPIRCTGSGAPRVCCLTSRAQPRPTRYG